jgi:hypothetical protein
MRMRISLTATMQELDEAHRVMVRRLGRQGGKVTLDYRAVHDYTLTDEAEYIKPKARVY